MIASRYTYEMAVKAIAGAPQTWLSHPRPYPELESYGFRWIKIHRYWFGYLPGEAPIITNIVDEVADIPVHVSADRNPIDAAERLRPTSRPVRSRWVMA
jgi:hypothetical protein